MHNYQEVDFVKKKLRSMDLVRGRVALLEEVWPCWRKCALGVDFEVLKANTRLSVLICCRWVRMQL